MKVLRFALITCLVFGLTACAAKPTGTSRQQQGTREDHKGDGDTKPAARTDDKRDGDTQAAKEHGKGARDKAPKKEQLVGTWEVKTEGVPPGTTMEFTQDGKMRMSIKGPDKKTPPMEASYELDGDTIKTTRKEGDREVTENHKIITLNDKELVTTDEKGRKDTLKRK